MAVVIWVACLNAFWFYAIYYLVMAVAGWGEKKHACLATATPCPGDTAVAGNGDNGGAMAGRRVVLRRQA